MSRNRIMIAASLLLVLSCLIGLCARSYSKNDSLHIRGGTACIAVSALKGSMRFDLRLGDDRRGDRSVFESREADEHYELKEEFERSSFGFAAKSQTIHYRMGPTVELYSVLLPMWPLLVVVGAAGALVCVPLFSVACASLDHGTQCDEEPAGPSTDPGVSG